MNPLSGPPIDPAQLTAPEATAHEVIRQQAVNQDFVVMRLVVTGLVIAIILAVIGVSFLSYWEKEVPEGLIAIGSGATGALATMLVARRDP
jgi:uncharacterized integral membrane protein